MDYKARVTNQKVEAVNSLKDSFKDYTGFIFADYRGMTVQQITDLRNQLRKKDAVCKVVKNRYAKIALKDLKHEGLDEYLIGPTAVVSLRGDDESGIAKLVFASAKSSQKLVVKGGSLNGEIFDAAKLEAFSKLPSRLELIAILMGTMKAPVQKLAATLLAYQEKLEAETTTVTPEKKEEAPAEESAPAETEENKEN